MNFIFFFVSLRFVLDIYAVFIFLKVIVIFLVSFGFIYINSYIYIIIQYICSFFIDPLILILLYWIPWLDNELVAFVVMIFLFYHLHRLVNILAVGEDDSKITR